MIREVCTLKLKHALHRVPTVNFAGAILPDMGNHAATGVDEVQRASQRCAQEREQARRNATVEA